MDDASNSMIVVTVTCRGFALHLRRGFPDAGGPGQDRFVVQEPFQVVAQLLCGCAWLGVQDFWKGDFRQIVSKSRSIWESSCRGATGSRSRTCSKTSIGFAD